MASKYLFPGVWEVDGRVVRSTTDPAKSSSSTQKKGLLAPVPTQAPQSITSTNPYGTSTYNYDAAGNITHNVNLSAGEQAKFDAQNALDNTKSATGYGLLQQASQNYQNPYSTAGLPGQPDWSTLSSDYSGDRRRVEQDLYGRMTSRLDPQWEQERQRFEQTLANRGVARGSAAYESELKNFDTRRNDAYLDANSQAIQAGGAEQSRLMDMNIGRLSAQQGGRSTALQEGLALRSQPLNEYNSLMSGFGVNSPQFDSTSGLYSGTLGQQGQNLATAQYLKPNKAGGGGGGGGGMAPQMPMYDIMPDAQPQQPKWYETLGQGFLQGATQGIVSGLFGSGPRFGGGGNSIFG
jgi:hypothetical protein